MNSPRNLMEWETLADLTKLLETEESEDVRAEIEHKIAEIIRRRLLRRRGR